MVIGGSLAGLLAAQVLTEHADRVTVVDRDRLPSEMATRAGVPQSRHPHVLLDGGQRAIEELLPGFLDELRAAGSPRLGMPTDMVQWQNGQWLRRTAATTWLHTGSRDHLEQLLRQRVLAHPAISVAEGSEVVGLLGNAGRVRGVLLRERGEGVRGEQRSLEADLVVDASGRGTKSSQWLAALGAEAPHEERIDTGLAYSSRIYRDTTGELGTVTRGYYVVPNPAQPRAALVLPREDGTYMVTLSGLRDDRPPTDEEGYLAYAAERMPHPLVHRWLSKAEPLTPVFGFQNTANVRRRLDLAGRRPAGFLATGDALCTFNPIYGQGMTVAAKNAVALRDALSETRRTPTTLRVQQAILASSNVAWNITAGADKKMPGATGNAVTSRLLDRPVGWYLSRVQQRYPGDPEVGRVFRSVLSLTSPVTALFAPAVMRAVLFGPVAPTPTEPPMTPEEAGA